MDMDEYVNMWEAIAAGKSVNVPAQLHLRGQMKAIADALGGYNEACKYFKQVRVAEPALVGE